MKGLTVVSECLHCLPHWEPSWSPLGDIVLLAACLSSHNNCQAWNVQATSFWYDVLGGDDIIFDLYLELL